MVCRNWRGSRRSRAAQRRRSERLAQLWRGVDTSVRVLHILAVVIGLINGGGPT